VLGSGASRLETPVASGHHGVGGRLGAWVDAGASASSAADGKRHVEIF
jgi:hypothetical protein